MGKRGSGGGGGASNAKELKMFMKNRMWRDHWYVIVAVVTIVVAVFSASVFQFSTSKDHIYRIDVTNEPLLARVFQSGEPWVVLCSKPDDIMPDVFSKASKRLADKSFAGVIDCTQQLPASGKTVLARFGIKKSISPTVFTVANGEKPKQVFLNYLQTSKALAKHVMEQTKKTAVEVLNSAQLDAKCLQKAECVLLLRGAKWKPYERQWIDRLLEEHRKVAFAWLDASVLKLSIEASLPKAKPGEHRLVLFKKQRDAGSKKKATVTAKAFRNVFELLAVRQFLEEALPSDLTPLAKAPTLSRRKTAPKAQPKDSDDAAPRESYAERRRRERRQAELERGSDSVFPEAADEPTVADGEVQSAADNGITDIVDEVIDLDELDE